MFVAERHVRPGPQVGRARASMGPQLVRCGKPWLGMLKQSASEKLQWGRNLFVAERCSAGMVPYLPLIASMGPQLVRCGKVVSHASKRPAGKTLQWGRNLFVAESGKRPRFLRRPQPLQWGRNLFVAERWVEGFGFAALAQASMGPQLVRCGKLNHSLTTTYRPWASMGPQLVRCGKGPSDFDLSHRSLLQWGRNLFVAESGNADSYFQGW